MRNNFFSQLFITSTNVLRWRALVLTLAKITPCMWFSTAVQLLKLRADDSQDSSSRPSVFRPPLFPFLLLVFFCVCVCVILCQLEHELFAHTHTKKSPPSHPLPSFLFTSGTSIHQRECHLSLPQHLPISFYNVQVVVAKLLTYPRRNLRTSLSLTVIAHIIDSDACLNEE